MIMGAGELGQVTMTALERSANPNYKVVGFIDDNTQLQQNTQQNTTQVNHKNILDDLVKLNNYMILSSAEQTDIENIMKKRYNKPFDIIGLQTQYLSKFNLSLTKN